MATRRFAARIVVLDPANRVLLFNWANPRKGTNWWATPGGGLEQGERSRDAAVRELREETGIIVDSLEGPVWRSSHYFRSGAPVADGEKRADLIYQSETFFLARVTDDAVSTDGFDSFEVAVSLGHRWWTLEDLEDTPEAVYPRGLGALVGELLESGVPARAVAIKA